MLAETKGQISLALRHRGDNSEVSRATRRNHLRADGRDPRQGREKGRRRARPRTTSGEGQSRSARNSTKKRPRAPPKKKPKEEAAKPTWKLRVYEGEKLREEQVELPAEPVEPGKETAQPREQLKEFLKRFFQSASEQERQLEVVRRLAQSPPPFPECMRKLTGRQEGMKRRGAAGRTAGRAASFSKGQRPFEVQGCSCLPSPSRRSSGFVIAIVAIASLPERPQPTTSRRRCRSTTIHSCT